MRKIVTVFAAVGLLAGALSGCSGTTEAKGEPATQESVVGAWVLDHGTGPGGDIKPVEGQILDLTFEADGAFHGSSGCNTIVGTAVISDGSVDLGPIAQTKMLCEDPVQAVEDSYSQALGAVDKGTTTEDHLTLTGEKTELHYKKA